MPNWRRSLAERPESSLDGSRGIGCLSSEKPLPCRWWEPILIPGLLQTADYARALFQAWQPASSEDDLDALVNGRLERQSILGRDGPPDLWVVLDESVLHRLIGSPKVMHGQLEHVADTSCRPMVTVQVIPAELGAHGGLLGAFILAGPSSTVYLETAVEAQITGDDPVKERAALTFDRLTRDALPRGASRDLIRALVDGVRSGEFDPDGTGFLP